jgi:hypothetical protein
MIQRFAANEISSSAAALRVKRWRLLAVSALMASVLIGDRPSAQPPASVPPGLPAQAGAAAPAPAATPMDEPLRLIRLAAQTYQGVHDYRCLLIKREQLGGRPQPDHVVNMMVRVEPFSVFLHWQAPQNQAGQEACYVQGQNGGKMRVHAAGVLGAVGFVSLDPADPRARQNSRHSITEAGIGNLIKRYHSAWETEQRLGQTQVNVAEYEYNKRRCTRVETIHPVTTQGQFLYYRSVLYFDKENHLPVRAECYGWPRYANDPGELMEVYSFVNLQLNVGLPDSVFKH